MLTALILTFGLAHAALVTRCLIRIDAPAFAYMITIPMWFVAWPVMSLHALWTGIDALDDD